MSYKLEVINSKLITQDFLQSPIKNPKSQISNRVRSQEMKHLKYFISVILVGSVLSFAQFTQPAQAQVAYGSYVGVGPAVGLSDGAQEIGIAT